jgi:hypothetical protein
MVIEMAGSINFPRNLATEDTEGTEEEEDLQAQLRSLEICFCSVPSVLSVADLLRIN